VLADQTLARRLERAEAVANARFVEARARIEPELGAQWIEVAGAYAMFDGVRSPCTQTFGLGMFQLPSVADLDRIESFFKGRGAPVLHEVCPCAEKGLLDLLNERGYRAVEFSNVMFLPLSNAQLAIPTQGGSLRVRITGEQEQDLWARTAAEGWRELTEIADLMPQLLRVSAARAEAVSFLGEWAGQPIAAGSLTIHEGIALLAGASTIPEWRGRGAQKMLLGARLKYALEIGCDVAMMCAEPGSISQRNAERHGFRVAYTRTKFGLAG
jgi:GNAT superfamily N-acetyltransferase